jgi:hypothetical protein
MFCSQNPEVFGGNPEVFGGNPEGFWRESGGSPEGGNFSCLIQSSSVQKVSKKCPKVSKKCPKSV